MSKKCSTTSTLYTLSQACELLSVSTATGRNWIKAGKLCPSAYQGTSPRFTKNYLSDFKASLAGEDSSSLKKRRNKTYVSGKQTCSFYIDKDSENRFALKQLLTILEKEGIFLNDSLLLCLLRHCAEQLFLMAGYENTLLFESLLNDLVPAIDYSAFRTTHASLCETRYAYYRNEDTLGFLYLSLRNLSERKASGSYYTPARLAKQLVEKHLNMLDASKTILDPSCGTGVFLLQLPDNIPLRNIYGNDLNPVSVVLARINLALKYHITVPAEIKILQKNITVSDFLYDTSDKKNSYDIILGNPPWGARLSTVEKKNYRQRFSCATGSSVEIYDLFLEQSLNLLSPKGILSFILPEALLTVKFHTPVRELLLRSTSVLSVEYLGEVFEQVHCPSIILTVTKNTEQPFFKNVSVTSKEGVYSTRVERIFSADSFAFAMSDEEYLLLQKIQRHPKCTTLVDNSAFVLGIVTGSNSSILKAKAAPGLEPVIKGTDISKYHINSYSGYLKFQPESFQQTAPEHLYRAPEKLFYRFINQKLTFAYDNTGLLSLNSCNILIPNIDGLSMKYILAILNSGVAQFVFEKKFRSVKVLRSHLEQIPIPVVDAETQKELVELVEILMRLNEASLEYKNTFDLLDRKIAELFSLTEEEYKIISKEAL